MASVQERGSASAAAGRGTGSDQCASRARAGDQHGSGTRALQLLRQRRSCCVRTCGRRLVPRGTTEDRMAATRVRRQSGRSPVPVDVSRRLGVVPRRGTDRCGWPRTLDPEADESQATLLRMTALDDRVCVRSPETRRQTIRRSRFSTLRRQPSRFRRCFRSQGRHRHPRHLTRLVDLGKVSRLVAVET